MKFLDATKAAGLGGKTGKQAVKAEYRDQVLVNGSTRFSGSVDLDGHFKKAEPSANRWDYGVGFKRGDHFALWVEPHPASGSGEVAVMLSKLKWLKAKLQSTGFEDLAALTQVSLGKGEIPYRWLYNGRTSFRAGGKEARQLAQNGMKLPERNLRVG